MKPAVVIVLERKTHDITRVMLFDDHMDAVDVWESYGDSKKEYATLSAFEHFKQGEKPVVSGKQLNLL